MRWLNLFLLSNLLVLCGCPLITEGDVTTKIGGEAVDDADGDGFTVAQGDCDDNDPLTYPEYWYEDADGDGYGDPLARERLCAPGEGYSLSAEDCDDADSSVNPGAEEAWYDGVDSDCDGGSDNDADGDGNDALEQGGTDCDDADAASTTVANDFDCDGSPSSLDCNDADESVYPGAEEAWYDGVDSDCEGDSDFDADGDGADWDQYDGTDCNDDDAAIHPGASETWYDDVDSDCAGDSDFDADGDGADSNQYGGSDCNDQEPTLNPNDVDGDGDSTCDGDCDDDDATQHMRDDDLDGFSPCGGDCDDTDSSLAPLDVDQDGWTSCNGDCNDLSASTFPGAAQIEAPSQVCMSDADDDGYGSDSPLSGVTPGTDCDDTDAALVPLDVDGDSYSTCTGDCDENSISVNPGATETWYDSVDGDCSGGSDFDADGDGDDSDAHGGTDCDDTNAAVNPAAAEDYATSVDENCVNDAPMVDSVTLSPASPTTDSTITASAVATDPEGDSVSLAYEWFVAGSVVAEVGDSLAGAAYFSEGQEVYVQVTPSDASLSGAPVASTSVLVGNSLPTAPVISLTPSSPTTDDNLVCAVDTESTDADGHPLSYAYAWTVNGAGFNGAADAVDYLSSTVASTDTSEGESWACDVYADDGYAAGPTVSEAVTLAGDGVCSSLGFQGADQGWVQLDTGVPAAIDGLAELTVEAWVYNEGPDTSIADSRYRSVVRIADSPGLPRGIMFRVGAASETDTNENKLEVLFGTSSGGQVHLVGDEVPVNTWSHLAAVYDGGSLTLYQDGVETDSTALSGTITTDGGTDARIGAAYPGGIPDYFNGQVADVRISSSARYTADFSPTISWLNDSDTVGLWHLGEGTGTTVSDSSDNGFDGTLTDTTWASDCPDAPTACTTTQSTLDLDGTGHAETTIGPADVVGATELTISAWVNPDASCSSRNCGVFGDSVSNGAQVHFNLVNGGVSFGVYDDTVGWQAGFSCSVDFGRWQHLAVVVNSSGSTLYQDGVELCSDTMVLNSLGMGENGGNSSLRFRIGDGNQSASVPSEFVGGIGPVGFWTRALSASEISTLASSMNETVDATDSDLVAFFDMEEGSGATLSDPTGHSATLTSSVAWEETCWGDVSCSDGSSSACAATSCKAIHDDGYSTGDGTYWIDPDGSGAFEAYCDMTTDGGGWTLLFHEDGGVLDPALPGSTGDYFGAAGVSLAYSTLAIGADLMLDASDVAMTGADQVQRTIITDVAAGVQGSTLFDIWNGGVSQYIEDANNAGVTNFFSSGDCSNYPFSNYSQAACDTTVFVFNDVGGGGNGPFLLGADASPTTVWTNHCGWPRPAPACPGNFPEYLRIFSR